MASSPLSTTTKCGRSRALPRERPAEFAGPTGIVHDETDFATAFALAQLDLGEERRPIPLGVFRYVERESL